MATYYKQILLTYMLGYNKLKLKNKYYEFRCLLKGEKGMRLKSAAAPATVIDDEPSACHSS